MTGYVTPSDLYYYQELMRALRGAIEAGGLDEFAAGFAAQQAQGDLEPL